MIYFKHLNVMNNTWHRLTFKCHLLNPITPLWKIFHFAETASHKFLPSQQHPTSKREKRKIFFRHLRLEEDQGKRIRIKKKRIHPSHRFRKCNESPRCFSENAIIIEKKYLGI